MQFSFSVRGHFVRSIHNLVKKTKKRSVRIHADRNSVAGNYLVETGFFEVLGEKEDSPSVDRPDRTVKLKLISTSSEIPAFASKVMDILKIEDEELEGAVKYSLIELLGNVVQHSASNTGGLAMAQYYPNTGLVNLCVADTGMGVKATFNEAYPEIETDLQALKIATLPHVSRTFGPSIYNSMRDNAGLGLFFIKQIASLSGGSFFWDQKKA